MNTKAKYFIVFCLFYNISAGYLHGQSKEIIRMNVETKNLIMNQITTSGKLTTLINRNKNGRIIKQHSLYKKEFGLSGRDIYDDENINILMYDEKNRLVESTIYSTNYRKYIYKRIYQYSDFDSLTKESYYTNFGNLDYLVKYAENVRNYDLNRLLIKRENYIIPFDGNLTLTNQKTTNYIYNNSKQLIRADDTFSNSSIFSIFYKYDNIGNLVEVLFSNSKKTMTYNKIGQLLLEETFNYNQTNSTYRLTETLTLQYDNTNKLTKRIKTYLTENNGKKLVGSYTDNFNQDGQNILSESTSYTNDINKNKPLNKVVYEYCPNKKLKQKTTTTFNVINLDTFDTYKQSSISTEIYEYEEAEDLDDSLFDAHLIYPNPANNEINIVNTLENGCLFKISLLDMLGKHLADFNPDNDKTKNQCNWKLQVSNFSVGTYLIAMTNPQGEITTKKIMINR